MGGVGSVGVVVGHADWLMTKFAAGIPLKVRGVVMTSVVAVG